MRVIQLSNIPQDLLVGNILAVNQYWKEGSSWDFFESPRQKHGFMHVICARVDITYPSGKKVSFPAGSFLYIPTLCRYRIEFIDTGELYEAGLAADRILNFNMRRANGELIAFADEIVCLEPTISGRVDSLMSECIRACRDVKKPLLRAMYYFSALLEHLSTEASHPDLFGGDKRKSAVSPAVLYLDSHVSSDIPIPELAKMCMLSVSAFRAAFKAYTGVSPVQYRVHAKIRKAEQLLRDTDNPSVKEISEELGFCECTYFCRLFRKITGMTPSEYRIKRT